MTLGEIPGGIAWAGIGISYLTGFFLLLKASSFQIGLISDFLIRGKRGCMVFSHRTMPVRASCRPFATPCQGR